MLATVTMVALSAERRKSQTMTLRAVFTALAFGLAALAQPAAAALPDTLKGLKAQAEAGDVDAQSALGRVYAYGWYNDEQIPADKEQARLWLSRAADAGSGEAAFEMGATYYPNDLVEAVPWYRKAAEAGITAVNPRLCQAYRAKALYNWDEALNWCAKAAEGGDTAPYLAMAKSLAPSDPQAIAIYTQLADGGEVTAIRTLADYYIGDGASVAADEAGLALTYTRPAVGLAPEIYIARLAKLYATATGMTRPDLVEAARLYQYALRFDTAKTPQTEARDWLAAHPDITRAQVDAQLLRSSDAVDARALKHGFARHRVDGGKTIGDFYPYKARTKGIEGIVMVECRVTDTGDLANCMVASETPQGHDFARQTLLIVSRFGLKSTTPEAFKPIAGRLVHIPFSWRLDD